MVTNGIAYLVSVIGNGPLDESHALGLEPTAQPFRNAYTTAAGMGERRRFAGDAQHRCALCLEQRQPLPLHRPHVARSKHEVALVVLLRDPSDALGDAKRRPAGVMQFD